MRGRAVFFAPLLLWAAAQPARANAWAGSFGGSGVERASAVEQASDRSFVVVGTASTPTRGTDLLVVRLDRCGGVTSQRLYGTAGDDEGFGLALAPDGGAWVVGSVESGSNLDFLILRLGADGSILWQRAVGGPGDDIARAVRPAPGGGIFVAGEAGALASAGRDAWILRLDDNGVIVWQRAIGAAGSDTVRALRETPGGGLIAAGATDSAGAGFFDAWAIELDAAGGVLWERTYGGSGDDGFESVDRTADGGFVFAGQTDSFGAGLFDAWVVRVDAAGDVAWQFAQGGADDDLASTVRSAGQGFVLGGETLSHGESTPDAWLLRLSGAGTIDWLRRYGGAAGESASSVRPTADGGLVAVGSADGAGTGGGDVWAVRTDAAGALPPGCAQGGAMTFASTGSTATGAASTPAVVVTTMSPTTSALTFATASLFPTVTCAASPDEVSPPGASQPLAFVSPDALVWEEASRSCASGFNLYRGARQGSMAPSSAGCLAPALSAAGSNDATTPPEGWTFFYIVTAVAGALEGSPGVDSSGTPRALAPRCP